MPNPLKDVLIERGIERYEGVINKGINESWKTKKQMKKALAKKKRQEAKKTVVPIESKSPSDRSE